MNPRYSIQSFISDAKSVLAQELPLQRLHFDVELKKCWPTHSSMDDFDDGWPPKVPDHPAVANAQRLLTPTRSLLEKAFCPQCSCHPGLWPDAVY